MANDFKTAEAIRQLHLAYIRVSRLIDNGSIPFDEGDYIRNHIHSAATQLGITLNVCILNDFRVSDAKMESIAMQAAQNYIDEHRENVDG